MAIVSAAPRFVLGAPIAALVTLMLGLIMQFLIARPQIIVDPPTPAPDLQIVSRTVDTDAAVRPRPTAPADVTPPEAVVIRPEPGAPVGDGPRLTYDPLEVEPGVPETGPMWFARPPRRLVTPQPIFPANARVDEGSCLVGFDVLTDGSTANVEVVSCTAAVFGRSALNAVKATRYEPGYGESGPVVTSGLRLEIVFRIEN
jgi:TonB family protein